MEKGKRKKEGRCAWLLLHRDTLRSHGDTQKAEIVWRVKVELRNNQT